LFETVIAWIAAAAAALTPAGIAAAGAALTALFVLCLCLFGRGGTARFCRRVRRIDRLFKKKRLTVRVLDGEMSRMPAMAAEACRRAAERGEPLGERLTAWLCVAVPFERSAVYKITPLTLLFTGIIALLSGFLGFARIAAYTPVSTPAVVLLVALAGTVCAFLGRLALNPLYKRAMRRYERLLFIVDTAFPSAQAVEKAGAAGGAYAADVPTTPTQKEREAADETPYAPYVFSGYETEAGLEPDLEDVITRIVELSETGAPIGEMKEIAALLRAQRFQPENRTPGRTKALDDAYHKLLDSIKTLTL
jgi:hypothetical protein